MKGSARGLVYFGNLVIASGVVGLITNCGGGERPQVSEIPTVDGSASSSSSGGTGVSSVTASGFNEKDGTRYINFGDDGFTNCNAQAPEKVVALKNNTGDVINFTAKLTEGSENYSLGQESGGIPIRGQATIQIKPKQIPADSEVTPDLYAGTLEITFENGKADPLSIKLHQTARGAIIKATPTSATIDFGNVKANTTADQLYTLTNLGNAEATATLQVATTQFKVDGSPANTAKIAAGATVSKTISFTPNDVQSFTDTLAVTFTGGVNCKPPPGNVNLKGAGTTAITISPGTLDFGLVDCGKSYPGGFLPITISSPVAATFTPLLPSGTTKYTLEDGSGSPVAVGATINLTASVPYTLRVRPKAIPVPSPTTVNNFGDTLTITTTAPGDSPHNVALRETANGAILAVSPTTITNTGTINQVFNNAFSIVNSGNASVGYTIAVTNQDLQPAPPVGMFVSNLASGTAAVGSTPGQLTVTLPNTFNTTVLAALQLGTTPPSAVLCGDLPGKYPLKAETGGGTSITVNPGALNFGQVDCGTTAAFQPLTLTSIVSTTFTPNLNLGAGSAFTLADGAGTALTLGQPVNLTANTPYTLRVVPKLVAIPSVTTANGLSDTLTINSPVDPVKSIVLSETARGAIFAFSPTSITGANGTHNFTLVNSGNAPGAYTLTTAGGTTSITNGTAPVGSTPGVLTKTGVGSITLTSNAVRCADLPAPLSFGPAM